MIIGIPKLSRQQELFLRALRKNPGTRGNHLIQEINIQLGREDWKKNSSGIMSLNGLCARGFIRTERPEPRTVKYFITAEGRTLLDQIDERNKRCQELSLPPHTPSQPGS